MIATNEDAALLLEQYSAVPQELKELSCWVTWKGDSDGDKQPFISGTTDAASTNNFNHLVRFEQAISNVQAGKGYPALGFVPKPPFVGMDLDSCRNPLTGEVQAWATEFLKKLGPTYTEVTPSQTGIRAWVKAPFITSKKVLHIRPELAAVSSKAPQIEPLVKNYGTITGDRYGDCPSTIAEVSEQQWAEIKRTMTPFAKVKDAKEQQPATSTASRQLIPHGQIHAALCSQAGRMRKDGHPVEGIEAALLLWAHENCEPPIDEKKVQQIARSMQNYEQEQVKVDAPLVTISGDDFLAEDIPPRKVYIRLISTGEPVIFEQSINQIFAWRGVGKTCLGLGFACCLATAGDFLNFRCEERVHVLYVEGELPASQMQDRWKAVVGKTDGYAHLATIDKQPGNRYASLATDAGMTKIENKLAEMKAAGSEIKVILFDSISTLFNIQANEEDEWIRIQEWFISLRSRGVTVFFLHHAGKGGFSRSHSKSEDMLDVSIKLEAPDEQEPGHLHAIMSFDKARAGLNERPAEIKLQRTHSEKCKCGARPIAGMFCPGDGVKWEHAQTKNPKFVAEGLFAQGAKIKDVASLVKVPEGTVKYWHANWAREHAKNSGLFVVKPEEE